jgi:hypothetical protein
MFPDVSGVFPDGPGMFSGVLECCLMSLETEALLKASPKASPKASLEASPVMFPETFPEMFPECSLNVH